MKKIRSIAVAALAVVVAVASVIPAAPVVAESTASSSAFSVSPHKKYEIEPGKSVDDKLTIRNADNASPLELTLRVVDFTFDEKQDSGVAKFFLDPKVEPTPWSLTKYIEVPKTLTIAPGQSKTVDIKVSIPANQGAGSLYSAIIYSSAAGGADNTTNVGLSASMSTLVFANVPGDVKQELLFEKLGPYKKPNGYLPYFTTTMPDMVGYTLTNKGNWNEAPVGSITLDGWFGRQVVINKVNPTEALVLIGQTRTFSSCIKYDPEEVANARSNTPPTTCVDPGLWPGYYKVTADLFYGANGNETKELIKSAGFWYLPWWFIALVLVVLGAGIFYGRKAYIKIRTALYGPQTKGKPRASRRR